LARGVGTAHGRAEITQIENAIAVAPDRIVHFPALLRNVAGEIDRVGGFDRRTDPYERRAGAVPSVRRALRGRRVGIEVQGEAVRDLPVGIQAIGLELRLGCAVDRFKSDVIHGPGAILLTKTDGGSHDIIVVERHFAEWLLEPVSLFRTLFIDLVLRVEGVGRQRQRLHRAELQGRLSIDALAREFRIVVPAVVGDRDQLILGGRVCNDGARNTPRHRRERLDRPTVHRRAGGSAFTLLVRAEQGDAEHLVRVRPRGDPRNLGIDPEVLVAEVVKRLRADTSAQAFASSIERPLRDNVDGRTDTARRNRGPAGLVDFKAADTFSREIREVERTAGGAAEVHREVAADGVDVGSRNLTPVDGNAMKGRTEAADRDLRACAVAAFDALPRNTPNLFG